jgi:hypothetical protein
VSDRDLASIFYMWRSTSPSTTGWRGCLLCLWHLCQESDGSYVWKQMSTFVHRDWTLPIKPWFLLNTKLLFFMFKCTYKNCYSIWNKNFHKLMFRMPIFHTFKIQYFVGIFFGGERGWNWDLNSGQAGAQKAGTRLLEPCLQSILLWLFWRWGLRNCICLSLKPQSSQLQPSE